MNKHICVDVFRDLVMEGGLKVKGVVDLARLRKVFLQMSIQLQNANTLNFELLYTEHHRINVASSTLRSSYDE